MKYLSRLVNRVKQMDDRRFANIVYISVLSFALLELVAWMPSFYIPSDLKSLSSFRIDISTEFLIPHFYEKGVQFGKDIVFSYGPLGFIKYSKYHPATYHWMLLGQILLSISFVTAMWRLIPKDRGNIFILSMGMFLCSIIMMLVIRPLGQDAFLLSFITLSVVVFYFIESKQISITYVLLLFTSALTTLIKVSLFSVVFTIIIIITISEIFDKKRFPVSILIFLAAFLLFWLFSKQSLSNLPEYLRSLSHMVGGYTDAMSLENPEGSRLVEIILYCLSCSLMLALLFSVLRPKERLSNLLPLAAIALILFVIFKHSFVRHCITHDIEASFILLLFLFIIVAILRNFNLRGVAVKIFYMYVAVSIIASLFIPRQGAGLMLRRQFKHLKHQIEGIGLTVQGSEFKQRFIAEREAIKKLSCLPVIDGSVDLYPDNLSIVMGADLYYKPRPAIISHGAYTPYLARLDAEHLKGNNAAQVILFKVETIDNRYPSIDDGLSWPEIWTRYRLDGKTKEYLILHRSDAPLEYSMTKVKELDARFGDWVSTPDINGLIWAEIEIKHTLFGRLMRFLFKLPEVSVKVILNDGQGKVFRIIPEMVKAGFLLSPLVENNDDFNELMKKDQHVTRGKHIQAISLMIKNWWHLSSESSVFFSDDFRVRYYKINLQ